MSNREKEGSLDDFIHNLISYPPQKERSIHLELISDDFEASDNFKVLIEIFTKMMKGLYGDERGRVNLDVMGPEEVATITKYFASFGFQFFVDKFEGNNKNKTSFGTTEERPIKDGELKAECLKIQTQQALYVIFFDFFK